MFPMKRKTQKDKVRQYLESGRSITPIEALEMFGSFRLGAIIFTLREEGMPIKTDFVTNRYKTKFAKYTLEQKTQPSLF
jgi:hypothetical protein